MTADQWNAERTRFGHLLEAFVFQQLIALAGWGDKEMRFWHYRDKDQVEVDLVIETGNEIRGIEVKAAASIHPSDGKGLRRLAEKTGKHFRGGIVFYDGHSVVPLDAQANILAKPFSELWKR